MVVNDLIARSLGVRIRYIGMLLALFGAVSTESSASKHSQAPLNRTASCDVAEAFVVPYLNDRRVVLSNRAPVLRVDPEQISRLRAGWTAGAPPLALISTLIHHPPESTFSCSNVESLARRAGAEVLGEKATDAKLAEGAFVTELSMPVVSKDGRVAVAIVKEDTNHLAGSTRLILMQIDSGKWKATSVKLVSVS